MLELKLQIRYSLPIWFITFFTGWFPENKFCYRFRGWLAHFFIKKCGRNFQLGRDVTLLNTFNLEIGDNVYLAKGGWYNALGHLSIGDEVVCAPYVVISTLQHVFKNKSIRFGGSIHGSVSIGKGSWIASHSSIKCGVKIGMGCLVASNASVIRDVDDFTVVGGVPAKVIKGTEDTEASIYTKTDLFNI